MSDSCLICNSSNTRKISDYKGNSALFKQRYIHYCKECDYHYISPSIPDFKLDQYNSNYFQNAHQINNLTDKAEAYYNGISKIRINFIAEFLGETGCDDLNVVEIGPGFGHLAKNWKQKFRCKEFSAIEPDKKCASTLEKIGIQIKTFDDFKDKNVKYDLIILSHILEHVNDPLSFVRKLKNALSARGAIFIDVPCMDFMFKQNVEPHISFFNLKSLKKLCELCGFQKYRMKYFGVPIKKLSTRKTAKIVRYIASLIPVYKNLIQKYPIKLTKSELIATNYLKCSEQQYEMATWIRLICKIK